MPITLLDIILLAVMLLSGLLALVRGFMREILSIAAWAAAAIATIALYPRLLPMAVRPEHFMFHQIERHFSLISRSLSPHPQLTAIPERGEESR